jgi:hypothetical protein
MTFMSVVTTQLGFEVGFLFLSKKKIMVEVQSKPEAFVHLAVVRLATSLSTFTLLLGLLLTYWVPVVYGLWSVSFTLITAGLFPLHQLDFHSQYIPNVLFFYLGLALLIWGGLFCLLDRPEEQYSLVQVQEDSTVEFLPMYITLARVFFMPFVWLGNLAFLIFFLAVLAVVLCQDNIQWDSNGQTETAWDWMYSNTFQSWVDDPQWASFLFSLPFLVIWTIVAAACYYIYRIILKRVQEAKSKAE